MYQPRHFAPWEVLPHIAPDITWDTLPDSERAKIADSILETGDQVRELLGVPCRVNDYNHGGTRQFCGVREPGCQEYSPTSRHAVTQSRPADALDLHPQGLDADTARARIRAAVATGQFPLLGGMELGVSWVHVDCRPRVGGKVLEFHV